MHLIGNTAVVVTAPCTHGSDSTACTKTLKENRLRDYSATRYIQLSCWPESGLFPERHELDQRHNLEELQVLSQAVKTRETLIMGLGNHSKIHKRI